MLFGFREPGLLEVVDPEHGVDSHIARIAAQGFLPVRLGLDSRVVELFGAQSDQVQLLDGLDVGRRQADS